MNIKSRKSAIENEQRYCQIHDAYHLSINQWLIIIAFDGRVIDLPKARL